MRKYDFGETDCTSRLRVREPGSGHLLLCLGKCTHAAGGV